MSDKTPNDPYIINIMMDILSRVGKLEQAPIFLKELENKYGKENVDLARERIKDMLKRFPGAEIDGL